MRRRITNCEALRPITELPAIDTEKHLRRQVQRVVMATPASLQHAHVALCSLTVLKTPEPWMARASMHNALPLHGQHLLRGIVAMLRDQDNRSSPQFTPPPATALDALRSIAATALATGLFATDCSSTLPSRSQLLIPHTIRPSCATIRPCFDSVAAFTPPYCQTFSQSVPILPTATVGSRPHLHPALTILPSHPYSRPYPWTLGPAEYPLRKRRTLDKPSQPAGAADTHPTPGAAHSRCQAATSLSCRAICSLGDLPWFQGTPTVTETTPPGNRRRRVRKSGMDA